MEEKIIIVPRARPAVDFASNLLVIPKDDFDEYVNEINAHHVKFIRSLESSWNIKADGRAIEAIKMVKEEYKEIIAKKDKEIVELKEERRWRKFPDEKPEWGKEVLVVDDESKHYIVRFSHDMKWISWGKMNTCESENVKYWMPLPSAPKEEK